MSVGKRRGKFWAFRKWVRTPGGELVRVTGVPTSWGLPNTRAAAEEAERIATGLAREGKPWRASEMRRVEAKPEPVQVDTVASFAPKFLELAEVNSKHSAFEATESAMRVHILPSLGEVALRSLDYARLEDFKLELAKKPARRGGKPIRPKTVKNVLDVAVRMLRTAKRRGLIEKVPDFEPVKIGEQDFDFLDFDEAPRLVAAAPEGEVRTMVLIAWKTGARLGELLGLRWEDVDLVAGKIRIRQAYVRKRVTTPKNRKYREIPLSPDAKAALKAHRHLRGELVFSDPDGKHWSDFKARDPLLTACKRAGLRRIGWHVLRHTFASHLVMLGVPITSVQKYMGHANIAMTMRYAHLSPAFLAESIAVIDGRPVPDGARRDRTGQDSA